MKRKTIQWTQVHQNQYKGTVDGRVHYTLDRQDDVGRTWVAYNNVGGYTIELDGRRNWSQPSAAQAHCRADLNNGYYRQQRSAEGIDDEANIPHHRNAARLARDVASDTKILNCFANDMLVDANYLIHASRIHAKKLKELMAAAGPQPYSKEYAAAMRRYLKRMADGGRIMKKHSQAITRDLKKLPPVGDELRDVVCNRVLCGDRPVPTNHAQLQRYIMIAPDFTPRLPRQDIFDRHAHLWGLVGGWRWSQRVKTLPGGGSKYEVVLKTEGGSRGKVVLSYNLPKLEMTVHEHLQGIIGEEDVKLLDKWGSVALGEHYKTHPYVEAPSEALTSLIAGVLNIPEAKQ